MTLKLLVCTAAMLALSSWSAEACTRVLWNGENSTPISPKAVIVGRNMDWAADTQAKLWAFPKGVQRTGLSGDNNPLTWTSKYNSVAVSFYDEGTADGMNEEGLVVNTLWLTEACYGPRDISRKGLSLSLWTQFMLDKFATVKEAVKYIEDTNFQLIPVEIPFKEYKVPVIHMALADASGDSAVIEYVWDKDHAKPKTEIHHGKEFTVMANSPTYQKQLDGLKKYDGFGGKEPLPGTSDEKDRFVRASYYRKFMPNPADYTEAVASVLAIMRNAAQPFLKVDKTKPQASHTLWRTVGDATNKTYFYESVYSPNIIWVRLKDIDFKAMENKKTAALMLNPTPDLVGDVTHKFKVTKPLSFKEGDIKIKEECR